MTFAIYSKDTGRLLSTCSDWSELTVEWNIMMEVMVIDDVRIMVSTGKFPEELENFDDTEDRKAIIVENLDGVVNEFSNV